MKKYALRALPFIVALYVLSFIYSPQPRLLVVVLVDGFPLEYIDNYNTPNIDHLIDNGAHSKALISQFPTKSLTNYHTIATGLFPKNHGILANIMYNPATKTLFTQNDERQFTDSTWWIGEPIWVTAERQGLKVSTYSWFGTSTVGQRPSNLTRYDFFPPDGSRVIQVINWIEQWRTSRPNLIMFSLNQVDTSGHNYGINSKQLEISITNTDVYIGKLWNAVQAKSGDLILLSDHGMEAVEPNHAIYLDDYINTNSLVITELSPIFMAYTERVDSVYNRLKFAHPALTVYRKSNYPEIWKWGYGERTPDIVAIASSGWYINKNRDDIQKEKGLHGYASLQSYNSLFVGAGPSFKKGAVNEAFSNVHIYELMAYLLNIEPAPNDGSLLKTVALLSGHL